jgi:hypothetical protein
MSNTTTFDLRLSFKNLVELRDFEYKEKLSFLFEEEPIFKNRLKSLLNDLYEDLYIYGDMSISILVTIYTNKTETWFNFIVDSCYPFFDNEINFSLSTYEYQNPLPEALENAIEFDSESIKVNDDDPEYTDYVVEQDILKTKKALQNLNIISNLLGIGNEFKDRIYKFGLGYQQSFNTDGYRLVCQHNKSYSFSLYHEKIDFKIHIEDSIINVFYYKLSFNLDFSNEDKDSTFETLDYMLKLLIKQHHKEKSIGNIEDYLLLKEMEII